MSTTVRHVLAEHRSAVAELRDAIRAVEIDPWPASLTRLNTALADLTLNVLEDAAEGIVRGALAQVSLARDSGMFFRLSEALKTAEEMLSSGPTALPVSTHAATQAAVELVQRCYAARDSWPEAKGSALYGAWDRAADASFGLLRAVTSFLYGERGAGQVVRGSKDCSAAVRRAVAYLALMCARDAMAKAARGYGLFVIGGRQPLPDKDRGAWTREIGKTEYRFEVTPSDLFGGAPYGWLVVTRVSDSVTVHALALTDRGWSGGSNSRISEALYAI